MKKAFLAVAIALGAGMGFIYAGLYPVGADSRHHAVTFWLLETIRERSIARASKDIEVPDLSQPDLLLMGGPDYNDMCASCHLAPSVGQSDLSLGLYPSPPNLSTKRLTQEAPADARAQRSFWIIKHGIKASGMPAWGPTHSDERIWAMVAFIQHLPELTEEQYQILTARDSDAHH